MSANFAQRFLVQLRADLRLLAWPALAYVTTLLIRLWYRMPESSDDVQRTALQGFGESPVRYLTMLLPLWIVYLSIRFDAPANTNTASLTRPIGNVAQWWAKLVTLTLLISVPWVACDVFIAASSPHSFASWLAIIVSSLGNTIYLIALCAAVASLANSQKRLITMALVGPVIWLVWKEWLMPVLARLIVTDTESLTLSRCRSIAINACAIVTVMTAWWMAMAWRRPRAAMVAGIVGVIGIIACEAFWNIDWLARPQLQLDHRLALKFGKPKADDPDPGQTLWPELRISGLAKDEVCGVVAFAPVLPGKPWPGEGFRTDYDWNQPTGIAYWMNNDFVRPVMSNFPASDFWPNSGSHDNPARPPLAKLFKRTDQPWRLRLAVHHMKMIGEFSLDDVVHHARIVPLQDGKSLRLGPMRDEGSMTLHCAVLEARSTLLPEQEFAPLTTLSRNGEIAGELPFNFLLVSHDPEARENRFAFAQFASYWGGENTSWGTMFIRNNHRGIVSVDKPRARIGLGFTTEEKWQRTAAVQVWIPEERGTVDFDLTPEQLKQLLTPAVPSPPPSAR